VNKHVRVTKTSDPAPPWRGAIALPDAHRTHSSGHARRTRRTQEAHLLKGLDCIAGGLVLIEHDWRIDYLNAAAVAALAPTGTARADMLGKTLWQACPDLCGGALEAGLRAAMAGQEAPRLAWQGRCGGAPGFALQAAPTGDGLVLALHAIDPPAVGGVLAIEHARMVEQARHAASERKALLESERAARLEAERASQLKDEFLATLSHELRTPLSAILGWAQVLRRGGRDAQDLQRGLQTIERNARVQAQLIEDLLDVSRITSGKLLLEIEPVAPNALVEAAIETVRPAADAKGIAIERHFDQAPALVAGDPARLQQALWNLLSNAIKFTPQGGTVRVLTAGADGHVEITVADTGVGIKPEFMAHVFERFRQADASTTRRHGGLGLGLAIVKYLVEQHGGTVGAASGGEGQGASFTLRLPAASAQALAPYFERQGGAGATAGRRGRDLSGVKVLVVDDEPDARELVKRILSDCRASVAAVGSAHEALRALADERPDLLVSDLGMADIDGFALLAQVRALDAAAGATLPAIALTAFARPDDRVRALEAGFHAHIAKPVEPSELIAAVAAVLGAQAH
jgi:signal transduction histidine kinase/ActR/RegA family two-component response regulator